MWIPAEVFLRSALLYVTALASVLNTPPKKIGSNTLRWCVSMSVPFSSLQPPLYGIFRLGQCHFPLCMWIIEIRLSTVIVHCVEPSVIVNQNVLRDFSTQEKKKAEQMNDWLQEKDKNMTQHERAFIVLCIYAIVYVWIWRIWKYMLTNLYRVFYVMWNTWSRCSLLSLSLSFSILSSLSLFFFFFLFLLKTEHIRRTRLTLSLAFWTHKASCVHTWDAGSGQRCSLSRNCDGGEKHCCSFLLTKA